MHPAVNILGVDPGISGGLAVYNPVLKSLIAICDMPATPNSKGRKRIDLGKLALFLDMHAPTIDFVVIEDVHSMPGQGVASMFTFGQALGIVEGAAAAWYLPIRKVQPQAWKHVFQLNSDKTQSRILATQLFPEHSQHFKLVKDDGKAEASLLAVYGSLYRG